MSGKAAATLRVSGQFRRRLISVEHRGGRLEAHGSGGAVVEINGIIYFERGFPRQQGRRSHRVVRKRCAPSSSDGQEDYGERGNFTISRVSSGTNPAARASSRRTILPSFRRV